MKPVAFKWKQIPSSPLWSVKTLMNYKRKEVSTKKIREFENLNY
jgi:hypothetical protein